MSIKIRKKILGHREPYNGIGRKLKAQTTMAPNPWKTNAALVNKQNQSHPALLTYNTHIHTL